MRGMYRPVISSMPWAVRCSPYRSISRRSARQRERVPIVEGVRRVTAITSGGSTIAFSNSGALVYLPGPVSVAQQNLMLFDRKGGAEALALPPAAIPVSARLS